MGWKSIREHYGLTDENVIVKISEGRVHIGAGYLGSLLVLNTDGSVHERREWLSGSIERCAGEIAADPATFRVMYDRHDVFTRSLPVYTWQGDEILEKHCESLGWPNVTHDGDLMADNRYSDERSQVIEWAREDAQSAVRHYGRQVEEITRSLVEATQSLREANRILDSVMRRHPQQCE